MWVIGLLERNQYRSQTKATSECARTRGGPAPVPCGKRSFPVSHKNLHGCFLGILLSLPSLPCVFTCHVLWALRDLKNHQGISFTGVCQVGCWTARAPFFARESTCRPCDASTLARSPCKNTAVAMQRQLLFVFAATTAILMRFPTLTPLTKRITVGLLGQPTATADLSSLLRATGRPRSANQNATLIRRVSAAHLRSRRTVSNWSSTCCGAHPCASRRK